MITAHTPTPAHRDSRHAAIREALDRIDELLDPADPGRGLGAVLSLVMPHARGLAAQARLALAARCVAQRIRQEATDELLAAAAPFVGQEASAIDRDPLERRLRRKVRELRVVIELRLPGRLARADEALVALARSSSLNDTLRGFVVGTASRYRVLDGALIARLEALAPLVAGRSPVGTLATTCARLGVNTLQLASRRAPQEVAVGLFEAFAGANDALQAARARLAGSTSGQDRVTYAALHGPQGMQDLALLAIGSSSVPSQTNHGPHCRQLRTALASTEFQSVDRALDAIAEPHAETVRGMRGLIDAFDHVAGWAAPGITHPGALAGGMEPSVRLKRAISDYLALS